MAPLAIAVAGAGLALQYKQTLEEGKEAARLAELQQKQINRQAESELDVGERESREKRKQAKRFQASQIAQMAANGGRITGSNLSLLANTAREFEADAFVISRNFGIRAMELRNKGRLVRFQGQLARRGARIRGAANLAIGIGTLFLASKIGGGTSGGGTPASTNIGTGGSVSRGISPIR